MRLLIVSFAFPPYNSIGGVRVGKTAKYLASFGHDVRVQNGRVHLQAAGEACLPEIARWLVGQGVEIYHLGADHKSLEALFLEVMGEDERPG